MPRDATLPPLADRQRPALAVVNDAAVDAAAQRDKFEAMRAKFAPRQTEADDRLDDYDLALLGAAVVQIRINMALPTRDVVRQLQAVRAAAERAIVNLESGTGTSAERRILAKRQMEAARKTVISHRKAAGEVNPK